ncbi:hypothetical protein, partial [Pseudanabaena mucicola]
MTENLSTSFEANNDGVSDDIPLGNRSPLLVPPAIGQEFLQPKFIYPLGAVSLLNPGNIDLGYDFEPLNNSFVDSPFFDTPIQTLSLATAATNQSVQRESDAPRINSKQTQSVLASNQQVQRQTDSLNSSETSTITPVQTSNFELSEDIIEPQGISIIQREIDIAPIESTDKILSTASIETGKDVTDIVNNNSPEIQRTSDESSSESQTNETSLKNSNEIRQEQVSEQTPSFTDRNSQNQSNSQNTQDIQRKIESSASISTQHLPNQINQSNIDQTISSLPTNNIQRIQPSADNVSNFTNDSTEIIPKDSSIIAEKDNSSNSSSPEIIPSSSIDNIQRQIDSPEADNILQNDNIPPIQAQQDLDNSDSLLIRDNAPQTPISSDLRKANITNNSDEQIQKFSEPPDIESNLDLVIDNNQQIQRQSDSSITKDIPKIDDFQARNYDLSESVKTESIQRTADIIGIDSNISVASNISNIPRANDQQSQDSSILSSSDIFRDNIETIQRDIEIPAIDVSNFTDSNQSIQKQPEVYVNKNITLNTELQQIQTKSEIESIGNRDNIEPNIQSQNQLQTRIQKQSEEISDNNQQIPISLDLSNFSINVNNNLEQMQREVNLSNANEIEDNNLQVQRQSDISSSSDYSPIDKPQQTQDVNQTDVKQLLRSDIDSNIEQSSDAQILQRQSEEIDLSNSSLNRIVDSNDDQNIQIESNLLSLANKLALESNNIQRQIDISPVTASRNNISLDTSLLQTRQDLDVDDNPLIRNDVTQISVSSDLNDSNSASSNYEQIQRLSNLSNKDTDLSIDPLGASDQQVQRQTDPLNSSDTSTITPVQTSNFELSEDIVEPQDISTIQREIDIAPINSTDTILSTASIEAIKDVTDIANNNSPEIQRTSDESSSEAQTNETSLNNSNEIRQEQTSSFIDESSQ